MLLTKLTGNGTKYLSQKNSILISIYEKTVVTVSFSTDKIQQNGKPALYGTAEPHATPKIIPR